jgi:hypothetical protein
MVTSRRGKAKHQKKRLLGCIIDDFDAEALCRLVEKRRSRGGMGVLQPIDRQSRTVLDVLADVGQTDTIEQLICRELTSEDASRDVKKRLTVIAGSRGYLHVLLALAAENHITSRRALSRGVVQIAHHIDCVVRSLLALFHGVDGRPFVGRVLEFLYAFPDGLARPMPGLYLSKGDHPTYRLTCADVHLFCPFHLFRKAAREQELMLQLLRAAAHRVPPGVLPNCMLEQLAAVIAEHDRAMVARTPATALLDQIGQSYLPLLVLCRLVARGFNTLMLYQLLQWQEQLMHVEWMRLRKWKSLDGLSTWHLAATCNDEPGAVRLANIVSTREYGGDVPMEVVTVVCRPMVNDRTSHGDTPFLLACAMGSLAVVKFCLAHSLADLRLTTARKETALILATKNGRAEVVSLLVQSMVFRLDVDTKRHASPAPPVLPAPPVRSEDHWLSWTAGNAGIADDNDDGEADAWYRLELSRSDVLQFIRHEDSDGRTALCHAKQSQHVTIVEHIAAACSLLHGR